MIYHSGNVICEHWEGKRGGKFVKIHFVSFAALTNLWFTVTVAGNNLVAFNCVFFSV